MYIKLIVLLAQLAVLMVELDSYSEEYYDNYIRHSKNLYKERPLYRKSHEKRLLKDIRNRVRESQSFKDLEEDRDYEKHFDSDSKQRPPLKKVQTFKSNPKSRAAKVTKKAAKPQKAKDSKIKEEDGFPLAQSFYARKPFPIPKKLDQYDGPKKRTPIKTGPLEWNKYIVSSRTLGSLIPNGVIDDHSGGLDGKVKARKPNTPKKRAANKAPKMAKSSTNVQKSPSAKKG